MDRRVLLGGAIGALGALVAVLSFFVPDLVTSVPPLSILRDLAAGLDPEAVLLAVGAVGVLLGVLVARSGAGDADGTADPFAARLARPPEEPTVDRSRRTGGRLDATVEAAVAGDESAVAAVTDRLRTTAVAALAGSEGYDRREALRAIQTGAWTDDETAAAVLAEDGRHDLAARLRLWLAPERERKRRLDRTLAAIERAVEGAP